MTLSAFLDRGAAAGGTPPADTGRRDGVMRRALRSWRTRIGLGLIGGIVALAFAGPFLAPHAPADMLSIPFDAPQPDYPLGTDQLGRDVLSRVLAGGQSLVWMSMAATALGVGLGAGLGLTGAYLRGLADGVIMRAVDVTMAFPAVVLALLAVTMFGPSPVLLVVLVGVAQAPGVARVIRGAAMSVVDREFVQYAQAIGVPASRVLVQEVVPNVTTPLLVEAGLRLMWSISALAGLSFLGYGIQPPAADWGLMINENRNALSIQPWAVIAPIAAIATFTVGGNLFTEGIARAMARTDGATR